MSRPPRSPRSPASAPGWCPTPPPTIGPRALRARPRAIHTSRTPRLRVHPAVGQPDDEFLEVGRGRFAETPPVVVGTAPTFPVNRSLPPHRRRPPARRRPRGPRGHPIGRARRRPTNRADHRRSRVRRRLASNQLWGSHRGLGPRHPSSLGHADRPSGLDDGGIGPRSGRTNARNQETRCPTRCGSRTCASRSAPQRSGPSTSTRSGCRSTSTRTDRRRRRPATGLSDLGHTGLLERLAAEVAAVECDTGLSGLGRFIVRDRLVGLLKARLRFEEYITRTGRPWRSSSHRRSS